MGREWSITFCFDAVIHGSSIFAVVIPDVLCLLPHVLMVNSLFIVHFPNDLITPKLLCFFHAFSMLNSYGLLMDNSTISQSHGES